MNKINKKVFSFIVVLLMLVAGFYFYKNLTNTGTATLSWNMVQDADLAGYKIYYGTTPRAGDCPKDSDYTDNIDIGKNSSYTIKNLEKEKIFYFSISSYDASGNESCFAEEVKKEISYFNINNNLNV